VGTTRVIPPEVLEQRKKEREERKKLEAAKAKEKAVKKEGELRAIVRLAGTDLDGEKPLWRAIKGIKGIGHTLCRSIPLAAGLDINRKLGSLNEQEMHVLEQAIKTPGSFGLPPWSLNRRRDPESGKDVHLTGSDLDVQRKFDIQHYVDLKTYRGIRHMYGLPVRGQHTRSTFRKGRVVGVIRKSALPAGGVAGTAKEAKEAKATQAQAAKVEAAKVEKMVKKEEKE